MNIVEQEDTSETRARYGIPVDGKVLLTAGILNRGKNIGILIESLSKIEMGSIYALIVGDGSTDSDSRYKDSLQALVKKLGVDKKVFFIGWLEKEDLWEIYQAADLFILPSKSEGMPNAILEALGLGLPCLGSNIPGIRDILQYEELLFDHKDDMALVNKIKRGFSDRQLLDQWKRLCQERKEVFAFDWKERVYQMVTAGFNQNLKRP